ARETTTSSSGSGPGSGSGAGPGSGSASAANEASQPIDLWRTPPAQGSVRKSNGLHLSWFHYRGPGAVHFDPSQIKTWEDLRVGATCAWAPVLFAPPVAAEGRITTTVPFGAAGMYVARARRRRAGDHRRRRDDHRHPVT